MIRELISPRCSREQRINESHYTITHSIFKQRNKNKTTNEHRIPPGRGNAKYSERTFDIKAWREWVRADVCDVTRVARDARVYSS